MHCTSRQLYVSCMNWLETSMIKSNYPENGDSSVNKIQCEKIKRKNYFLGISGFLWQERFIL